jgi:hypothetical protein
MTLTSDYAIAFDANCQLDPDSWFEDDTPQEQLDLLDNLVVSRDVAESMLLSGEVNWSHPGWWPDIWQILRGWAKDGNLIRLRLVADWLLSTNPTGDPDISTYLAQLAAGEPCEVFPGLSCRWPAPPEFYLSTLRWGMFEAAEFAVMDETATVNAYIALKRGK